jgi:uncharacterized protein with von Willebrand factor type A (vWA) domain
MTTDLVKEITSAVPESSSHFAIRADRWDRIWHDETFAAVERLREVADHLGTVHPAGADAMTDLFMILSKGAPRRNENIRPDRAVNDLIAQKVMDSDGVREVRRFTVGSQAQTALSCITFAPHLEALYADQAVQEAQEAAEAVQEAQDELERLLGDDDEPGDQPDGTEPGDQPGSQPGDEGEGQIAAAEAALANAQGDLDEALDRIGAKVGAICRRAADQAADAASDRAEAMVGWGNNKGEWDRMSPDEFIERAEVLDTEHFRRVAQVLGKMENLRIGKHREKVDGLPTEVWSVELGNDLGRLLPTEKLGLVDPTFEDDFFRRYAGRQLLQYRLRSIERKGAGGIIAIEDASGSMEGEPHSWAKGFGLALGSVARDQNRAFHVLEFGRRDQHRHHAFPDRRAWTVDATMAYASSFLNGAGTDFESPLGWAARLLGEEFDATGRTSGDVVMLTDGICNVSDAWLAQFLAEKDRLGFKVYVLLVNAGWAASQEHVVRKFADYVGTITNFTDGTDVGEVFKAVA